MGILDFRKKIRVGPPHPEEKRALEGSKGMGPPKPEIIRATKRAKSLNELRQKEYEGTRAWLNSAPISEERRAEALQALEDASHEIKDPGKAIAAFRTIRSKNDFRRL